MTAETLPGPAFDVDHVRAEFPILATQVNGKPLIYLDNGATTQKPQAVIDATNAYYASQNANIHRGVYALSIAATGAYESARAAVAKFLNAAEPAEIIFTRGTTDGINLIANAFSRLNLREGDEVIISSVEHHANIVPWQVACREHGATLKVIPVDDSGALSIAGYQKLLSPRTKMVAITHVSNALGVINDVAIIIRLAHEAGAKVLVDGAQWVAHAPTDVRAIDADFYVFSGHKLFGPTGIGVLYGKRELLDAMPPYQTGGDMVDVVTFEKTTFASLPNKFEAGTPNIAGAIGLAAAIAWLTKLGFDTFADHELALRDRAAAGLSTIPGLRILGTDLNKVGVMSFVFDDPPIAPLDVALRLDRAGIAVRTGHHCCMPLMARLGVEGTIRASFALYNTITEADVLVATLRELRDEFAKKLAVAKPARSPQTRGAYSPAAGSSPDEIADELVEAFELLGDAQSRLTFVEELGEKLPPMQADLKSPENFVKGCMSTVHIASRPVPEKQEAMELIGDSNTTTVKGLIAIVLRLFSGQPARQIVAFDINAFLDKLGIEQLVTVQRRIGLEKVIERVRRDALRIVNESKA